MNPEIQQLKQDVEFLKDFIKRLSNSTTIPLEVEAAFKERLGNTPEVSTKTAASETQSVNEAGASTYSVSKPPDGFITITVNGTKRNVPYMT